MGWAVRISGQIHQPPAKGVRPFVMDSSLLFSLNWNSIGELSGEDLEYVLIAMTSAMESGNDELTLLLSKKASCP